MKNDGLLDDGAVYPKNVETITPRRVQIERELRAIGHFSRAYTLIIVAEIDKHGLFSIVPRAHIIICPIFKTGFAYASSRDEDILRSLDRAKRWRRYIFEQAKKCLSPVVGHDALQSEISIVVPFLARRKLVVPLELIYFERGALGHFMRIYKHIRSQYAYKKKWIDACHRAYSEMRRPALPARK